MHQIPCVRSAQLCGALSDIRCEEMMAQFEIALKLGQCKIKTAEINEGDALVIFLRRHKSEQWSRTC